jgi:hypothetical protein
MHEGLTYRGGGDSMPGVARTSGGEAVRRSGDGADRLGGELGGGSEWSGWRRKTGRKGDRGRRWLLWQPGGAGREEKGAAGPGFGAVWRGKTGEREGAPCAAGDSSDGQHRPPAGGHRWRRFRGTGEGGGARATRSQAADRRDQATSGARWAAAGCGRE